MMINVVCAAMFFLWIIMCFVCGKKYHVITYVFWGVYVPLFLYQLNWSKLIDANECFSFDYIFVVFAIVLIIYSFFTFKGKKITPISGKICATSFGRKWALPINVIYLCLYLTENYLGSGLFFPGLIGVDIHTYSAPIISYFTTAQFLVLAYDYYYFKSTQKKTYLLFMLMIIIVPVITRYARMTIVMALVQLGSLVLFYELNQKNRLIKIKSNKKIKALIVVIAICGFVALSSFTQYRMDKHNADFTYASGILFTGPESFSWMAPFYGYFPLSFNNLKINLLYRTVEHNYIGLYSFSAFYFGILQLDNVLGISSMGYLKNRVITHGLATVPTAFWEFYYDWELLFFIPIVVALLLTRYFERMASNEYDKLTYHTLYFWYVSYWFFMSFQNTLFMSTMIVIAITTHFIIKKSFYIDRKTYE